MVDVIVNLRTTSHLIKLDKNRSILGTSQRSLDNLNNNIFHGIYE